MNASPPSASHDRTSSTFPSSTAFRIAPGRFGFIFAGVPVRALACLQFASADIFRMVMANRSRPQKSDSANRSFREQTSTIHAATGATARAVGMRAGLLVSYRTLANSLAGPTSSRRRGLLTISTQHRVVQQCSDRRDAHCDTSAPLTNKLYRHCKQATASAKAPASRQGATQA